MIIKLQKIYITAEKNSYSGSTSYNIKLGMKTSNTNTVSNLIQVSWRVKDQEGQIILSDLTMVKIGDFNTNILVNNLEAGKIYILEILNPDFSKAISTIYTGDNLEDLKVVDENFSFPPGPITVFGDLLFNNDTRKLFFPYTWKITNKQGNGIAIYDNEFYLFCPKHIFTSVKSVASTISFSPFVGFPSQTVKVDIIPKIKMIAPYTYSITPPTKINIVFYFKRHMIDPETNLLMYKDYKDPEETTTPVEVSEINLLDYNQNLFNAFDFNLVYSF